MDYLTPLATGGGGGVIGAVAMWLQSRQAKREHEVTREGRLQELYDSIMAEFRKENDALKKRIERFERRDARIYVIETCFRMVLPELIRKDPTNRTLAQVASLLRGVPADEHEADWTDILDRIDAAELLSNARIAAADVLDAARSEAAEVLRQATTEGDAS
jgi:hypothetical protein